MKHTCAHCHKEFDSVAYGYPQGYYCEDCHEEVILEESRAMDEHT